MSTNGIKSQNILWHSNNYPLTVTAWPPCPYLLPPSIYQAIPCLLTPLCIHPIPYHVLMGGIGGIFTDEDEDLRSSYLSLVPLSICPSPSPSQPRLMEDAAATLLGEEKIWMRVYMWLYMYICVNWMYLFWSDRSFFFILSNIWKSHTSHIYLTIIQSYKLIGSSMYSLN